MSLSIPKLPLSRKSITFQAILLGSCALVASALLSTGDLGTKDAIKLRAEEDLKASIGQVIANHLHDNDLIKTAISIDGPDGEPITVYRGTKSGAITALAYTVSSFGYSGTIRTIMALNPKGEILGVRVLSHTETPGLGDKIEIEKDDWVLSFNGLSLENLPVSKWAVKKDGGHFDQFSGATITPRAVVKAVKSGLDIFTKQQATLLAPATEAEQTAKNTTSTDINSESNEVEKQ